MFKLKNRKTNNKFFSKIGDKIFQLKNNKLKS